MLGHHLQKHTPETLTPCLNERHALLACMQIGREEPHLSTAAYDILWLFDPISSAHLTAQSYA